MAEQLRLHFQHNVKDILELNRNAREQRLAAGVVGLTAVGLSLTGLWMAFRQDADPSPIPVFVAAAFIFIIAIIATRLAGLGAWLLKTQKVPFELEIDARGVTFIDQAEPALVGWEHFRRWFMTPNLLALATSQDALAIPRRCCSDPEWEQLQQIVRNAIGSPARW
jgi:hypothetical protein